MGNNTNSLDKFSKPLDIQNTKLATVFELNPRDSKKGRLFLPVYDERFPLKFKVEYAYVSKFLEKDNVSGNHYHRVKQEILIPLHGEFDIDLEDVETKRKETISVSGDENKGIYVRLGVAHRIKSKREIGVLLVLASHHSTLKDEIEYSVS